MFAKEKPGEKPTSSSFRRSTSLNIQEEASARRRPKYNENVEGTRGLASKLSPLFPLPFTEPVSRQRHSVSVRPFPFTFPNVFLPISSPQSCTSNGDKHIINNPNEITSQRPPRPAINLGVSLSCENVPTQMAAFLCSQLPFSHPARMSSVMDDDVEGESSWEHFSAVRRVQESAHNLSPRGGFWELEDVVIDTTGAPMRFRCRTLSG